MAEDMKVSDTTRQLLLDDLELKGVDWPGALDELTFLKRLYPLDQMPSTDDRCRNMEGDVHQHRINWKDWDGPAWVYRDARLELRSGPSTVLLRFLSEMLHPLVRRNPAEVKELLSLFNTHLRHDGIEFAQTGSVDGRPLYGPRKLGAASAILTERRTTLESLGGQVRQQLERARSAEAGADPALAIGTAKEIVETVCKTVLHEFGRTWPADVKVSALMRQVGEVVEFAPAHWKAAGQSIEALLNNLWNIPVRLGELRNLAGTDHGRPAGAQDLLPLHARLALDAAATFASFVVEAAQRTKAKTAAS